MCGLERKSRTDPKAFARNPVDEDKANCRDSRGFVTFPTTTTSSHPLGRLRKALMVEGAGGADTALEDDGQARRRQYHDNLQVPFDRLFYQDSAQQTPGL